MNALVELESLNVSIRGEQILHDISLSLEPGECLAIVGESGAGKSVLGRTLIGLSAENTNAAVTAKRFALLGDDARKHREPQWRKVRGSGVGFILQDALQSLDPLRSVGAEVAESLAVHGVPRAARQARVLEALEAAGLDDPELRARQRSGELSGGMRQRALIAAAIASRPSLLIADEPTTALDATIAVRILDLLASLRDEGTGLVLISHDLAAVARVADRVIVLDQGRIVESGTAAQILTTPDHEVTKALVAAASLAAPPAALAHGETVVLAAAGVAKTYRDPRGDAVVALQPTSLEVHAGEAIAIVGESGSGKTTLARLLVAAESPDAGIVRFAGAPWSEVRESARKTRRSQLRFVPQDPLGSFDPRLKVRSLLRTAIKRAGASVTPEALLESVALPASVLRRSPRTLSGGQRQRVAIARALAGDPKVLILDEPVSALDVTVQAQILELLRTIQRERGVALVFITHDLSVARALADSVLVMQSGEVVERGAIASVFEAPQHPFTVALLDAARVRLGGAAK
ncbi:ATP-binding cassette domain-containing protein [Humidisolicoccus flavus]|uniref:ATP-binding cassette domain-containing protein n=1 Tax=Humidisolicoccus flavus TaxID=3111414 RepID=UPI003252731D